MNEWEANVEENDPTFVDDKYKSEVYEWIVARHLIVTSQITSFEWKATRIRDRVANRAAYEDRGDLLVRRAAADPPRVVEVKGSTRDWIGRGDHHQAVRYGWLVIDNPHHLRRMMLENRSPWRYYLVNRAGTHFAKLDFDPVFVAVQAVAKELPKATQAKRLAELESRGILRVRPVSTRGRIRATVQVPAEWFRWGTIAVRDFSILPGLWKSSNLGWT